MNLKHLFLSLLFIIGYLFPQTIDIKFASLTPRSSTWGKALTNIRKQVYVQTNKQVKIRVYWGGQMGDESEMIGKTKVKQLDGFALTGNGLGLISHESRVLELPGLFKNYEEIEKKYKAVTPFIRKIFQEKGFTLLSLSVTGNAYFFSKVPIQNFQDVSNSKMWLWKGDKFAKIIFDVLDINSIPVPSTDVIPSLQTNLINGFYSTPLAAISLQWASQVKYFLNIPITNVSGGIFLSNEAWDKLTEEQQSIILSITQKEINKLDRLNQENDKNSIKIFRNTGITVFESQKNEFGNIDVLHEKILNQLKNLPRVKEEYIDELYRLLK